MRIHTMLRLAAVAALAFTLAACGSSGGSNGGSASAGPMVTVGDAQCGISVSSTTSVKPVIAVPSCATKPAKFAIEPIVPGTGAEIVAGQNVIVKYVGIAWSTKKQFDASWPNTYTVTDVGSAPVIMGWNIGLAGQKVGSRVLLELPPDMAYGPAGQGAVGPNETLLFVIDIVSASS